MGLCPGGVVCPGGVHSPNMVNRQAVPILLECILVINWFSCIDAGLLDRCKFLVVKLLLFTKGIKDVYAYFKLSYEL